MAKLELVDVEMEIFLADLVECADDPAFHNRPESFDGVGMHRSADIFPLGMMHQSMRTRLAEKPIALVVIGRYQAHSVRDSFIDEAVKRGGISAFNHASDHVPLALHSTHHDELSGAARSAEVSAPTFPFVFILGFPTDIGFVHLDIADQFLELDIAQRHTDFIAQGWSRIL